MELPLAMQKDNRIKLVPYEEAYNASFEDMQRWVPDLSRISQYVGWQPECSLDTILWDVLAYFGWNGARWESGGVG